ncbi:MAG: hypothetical protein ACYSYL_00040 [Planctomycetota bacterium]|jgi:hypothetical protein
MTLLRNGDFTRTDGGHHLTHIWEPGVTPCSRDVPEIYVPPGWDAAWVRIQPADHDPSNQVGYVLPEMKLAPHEDPDRFRTGKPGFLCFSFHKIHWAGLQKTVTGIEPGTRLRLMAYAHAWSNNGVPPQFDNPRYSEGACFDAVSIPLGTAANDDLYNFTFRVGIDPTGGTNPFSSDVVWGDAWHIYNGFAPVDVEAQAQVDDVTVYLESRCMWPFKHNDAYWDDVSLVRVQEPDPDPVIATPTGSKLGIHTLRPAGVQAIATDLVSASAELCALKAVNDLSILHTAPAAFKVARITSGDEGCIECNDPGINYQTVGSRLLSHVDPYLDEYQGVVDAWEICNEPGGGSVGPDFYARLANLMKVCMDLADLRGIKLAIMSLNAGTPEWVDMQAMVATGVFQQAHDRGHIIALHEGVFGDDPVDKWWGQEIPGAPVIPPDAGPLCGRFLYLVDAIQRAGQDVPPFLISEFVAGGGYDNILGVMARFIWYDELLARHPEVIGVTPFTWGPVGQWRGYDAVSTSLVVYNVSVKDRINSAELPQPPGPSLGGPRVPYNKQYALLHESLTLDEKLTIVRNYWEQGLLFTVGHSFDDAMMHRDLDQVDVFLHGIPRRDRPAIDLFRDTHYPDAILHYDDAAAPDPPQVSVGVHDEGGAYAMANSGVPAWCTVLPLSIREQPAMLDYTYLKHPDVESTVMARLGWGFAHPHGGTMPRPDHLDAFIDALVGTIMNSRGIDLWQLFNEPNLPREWPGGPSGFPLTPEYVVQAYNRVYERVAPHGHKLALPAIDPYYGVTSDPGEWHLHMLHDTLGWDANVLHGGKPQTNDIADVFSDVRFDTMPWQYLHSKSFFPFMEQIPASMQDRLVMLGEVNPIRKGTSMAGTEYGWDPGNAMLVHELMRLVRFWNENNVQPITHVVFYRWEGDDWGFSTDGAILSAIIQEARRYA